MLPFRISYLFLAILIGFQSCAGEQDAPGIADLLPPNQLLEELDRSGDPGLDLDSAPELEPELDEGGHSPYYPYPNLPPEMPIPPPRPERQVHDSVPARFHEHALRNSLVIIVVKSEQRLYVIERRRLTNSWAVSTGAPGEATPVGIYGVTRMHKKWNSRQYDNARMDDAIFFHNGYALHATYGQNVRLLGPRRDGRVGFGYSHGCVRQSPENANRLFRLVQSHGARNTTIVVRN